MFDPKQIKKDFPILAIPHPSGKPLVYLDSAATSQKPEVVIDAISNYYKTSNANVHRGIHFLGDRSTRAWHDSRTAISKFFGADSQELIMVRNTTEALNLIAYSLEDKIHEGDVILATEIEHHSNLVPWQELARRKKAKLELIPVLEDGTLDLNWLEARFMNHESRIRILALTHVSNTLGTINPIEKILSLVSSHQSLVTVLDAAQSAPHMPIDFHLLGVDFMAVSAHKMLGPMGIGGLFIKKELLQTMKPILFGGGMIGEVTKQSATWSEDLEDRFTAGTPDVAGAVGWAAACDYLTKLGMKKVFEHDQMLVKYALEELSKIPEIKIIGPINSTQYTGNSAQGHTEKNYVLRTADYELNRCGSVAFVYEGVHAHDVAQILDSEGIAVRSGHHCTMPLHVEMGLAASTRASFNVYTTKEDIDALVKALAKVKQVFL
ncbi:MAG TPA: aminotransferase class V-fold PLP-dependent enzyme [Patescibacteria group bacterium]|nr:aminotransferase class V-fold PLP-dependent enzyme [Patescibacteria group bacterium]